MLIIKVYTGSCEKGRMAVTDKERIDVYELHIEDMLRAIRERLSELEGQTRDEFEDGRYLAYSEMYEIIKTRHGILLEVLGEE